MSISQKSSLKKLQELCSKCKGSFVKELFKMRKRDFKKEEKETKKFLKEK